MTIWLAWDHEHHVGRGGVLEIFASREAALRFLQERVAVLVDSCGFELEYARSEWRLAEAELQSSGRYVFPSAVMPGAWASSG